MQTFNIFFEPVGNKAQCRTNESILDCSRKNGLGINSVCGGQGTCHSCKIQLLSGVVSEITSNEYDAFSTDELANGWRLACRTYPVSDCRFHVPVESMNTKQRLQIEGREINVDIQPSIKRYQINLTLPSLDDLQADSDRLLDFLNKQNSLNMTSIDINVIRELPPKFRSWKGKFEAVFRNHEIIAIHPVGYVELGLAVDIGSTKIAVYLVDLKNGKTLEAKGIINPQISFGDDIISRVTNAVKMPDISRKLHEMVVEAINKVAIELCEESGTKPEDILDAVVVGNTVMHHMFINLPVRQLAQSPFIPAVSKALDIKARDLGVCIAQGGYIHILPNIAGFVGADHVAVLLAIDVLNMSKTTVALDIGTNTEISLIHKGEISSVSCASGPVFEGGYIKNGMRASNGAIERLQISGKKILYQTIGGGLPLGICGSGILDALAQLHLAGIIDKVGKIVINDDRVLIKDGVKEYILVSSKERNGKGPIVVSQRDVREVQLGKAAIRTGIEVLLETSNLTDNDIDQIIIAGAFGTYISVESAIVIGMLPPLPLDRFHQVGNSAGMGAKLALVSQTKRNEASDILSKVHYIELATKPSFIDIFMSSSYLGRYIFEQSKRKEMLDANDNFQRF